MATVRTIVHQLCEGHFERGLVSENQVELALSLFEGQYTEEKLAGILFIQEILLLNNSTNFGRDVD